MTEDTVRWLALWDRASKIDGRYALSEFEARVLWTTAHNIPQGGLIVELGVCHGRTAYVLADLAEQHPALYMGVDDWSLEGSREEVEKALTGYTQAVLIKDHTQQVSVPAEIDFLFIDAGHDEANIGPDCDRWIPAVVPGGYVAFHDYEEPYEPSSCHEAVHRHADRLTWHWHLVAYWGSLLIRRRPT